MNQPKPIRQHDTTTARCAQCKKAVEVPLDRGKIPDGVPWKCEDCGAIGNVDVFDDGTFIAVQRGGYTVKP